LIVRAVLEVRNRGRVVVICIIGALALGRRREDRGGVASWRALDASP
jgi:hypothetical protein